MSDWINLAATYKCPGCAGNLFFDTNTRKLDCKFCGTSYNPDVLDMLEVFSRVEQESDAKADDARHEIVCSSCGAVVITDENTSSSICCFCGSPALAARRLTKEFRPDYIIPFKVTKEEARAKFIEWASTNKYIPNDFTSEENINKLTGLYVPFWLVDCKCTAEFYGTGYLPDGANLGVFALERLVNFYLSRVPFDGSRKISNRLMAAVEPFDYSEMVEYKDAYLPGYYAERYDQTPLELSENVSNRARKYAEEAVKVLSCGQYSRVEFSTGYSKASEFKHSYALLPVWFMNYNYEGVNYGFAINGQTGEVCGDLPFSKIKRKRALMNVILLRLVLPLIPAILATLSFVLGPFLWQPVFHSRFTQNVGSGFVLLSVLGGAAAVAITGAFFKKWRHISNISQNPIDPPPNVEQYYDGTKKPEIKKKDKFVSIMQRPKDSSDQTIGGFWG